MNASHSAIDLAAYVEATREPGKKVFIWGGSYGTYWAHRYLQVAPKQADGVMIQAIAPADASFVDFDEGANKAIPPEPSKASTRYLPSSICPGSNAFIPRPVADFGVP